MLPGLFLTAGFTVLGLVTAMEVCFFAPLFEGLSSPASHCQPWLMQVSVDLGETTVSPHGVVDGGWGMG